ncbi:hypothetical protein EDB80DRAFT_206522 [Ilyonectria destructans]|nr:hypothetical protein EDB80DRAFT_206522 [Ilyonectria destructans]
MGNHHQAVPHASQTPYPNHGRLRQRCLHLADKTHFVRAGFSIPVHQNEPCISRDGHPIRLPPPFKIAKRKRKKEKKKKRKKKKPEWHCLIREEDPLVCLSPLFQYNNHFSLLGYALPRDGQSSPTITSVRLRGLPMVHLTTPPDGSDSRSPHIHTLPDTTPFKTYKERPVGVVNEHVKRSRNPGKHSPMDESGEFSHRDLLGELSTLDGRFADLPRWGLTDRSEVTSGHYTAFEFNYVIILHKHHNLLMLAANINIHLAS